ncbi:hypothetical protein GMOD_00007468 [Pyrenophora seminiperda CCB06]|uniref:NACHT domain-containing protein n=1 Tax=Pyrenophora seminiperda CCB06 TaxID=1302712 RepID=A0A3M7MDM5_9PLEO|nr:hypothetical protein GMOD_00007468 [Pyrenophora seminiperda CCB06]
MAAPSAQARLTLQDAFERFASTVTPDDKRLFHNTQLKHVRDEAMQIERQLCARNMHKNMARLDPFLQGMEHYSKVVEVLCNGTPYLPWIWAPVKLMLTITADSISAFEKLIEAYGKIADMLPRLDRLNNALVNDHNFQNVLALVYSDIIEFHRRAYKFVRRKSWAIFFGSMWANFESRFDGILKNLAYHGELADKEAAAAAIFEALRRSKVNDERWKQQEHEWQTAKTQKVLTWLGTNDTLPADLLERHIQGCLPGSCDWFVQHKASQLWLGDSVKNPLLWLCGKPGAGMFIFCHGHSFAYLFEGKSMICSTLVQHAEANDLHVFYYFCSFLGSHSNGPNRLLRSIVSQIIQKHQDLAIYVHDVYFKTHPVPTKNALLGLLPEILQGLGSVRLVVDGIDEWTPRDQKEVLKDLSQLISMDPSHICKIMISSRETTDIVRSLRRRDKSTTTISLSNSDEGLAVTHSIASFVDNKLSNLPDHFDELEFDASTLAHVKQTLLEKSRGMFLWVSLVLESLNTVYSPDELPTIVDDLPSSLEALYQQILVRLCNAPGAQSHGGVSRVMSWICFAQRPLHKSELLQALSISPYDTSSQVRSIPVASILDHCKPLIEELPDSTIVPVHFSVKEYLLKFQVPQIVPAIDAALDISSACAIVITRALDLVRLESTSIDHLTLIASGNYRLLPYAIEFWIEHCSQYASRGGSFGLDRPFQHHLSRMHKKHKDCLHVLGGATGQLRTQDKSHASHIVEKLEHFFNMPIHGLMADVLSLRQLVSEIDGDNSFGKFKLNMPLSSETVYELTNISQISKLTSSTTTERSSADLPINTRVQSVKLRVSRQRCYGHSKCLMLPQLFVAAFHIAKDYLWALPLQNSGLSMKMFISNAYTVKQYPVSIAESALQREAHSMRTRANTMASHMYHSYHSPLPGIETVLDSSTNVPPFNALWNNPVDLPSPRSQPMPLDFTNMPRPRSRKIVPDYDTQDGIPPEIAAMGNDKPLDNYDLDMAFNFDTAWPPRSSTISPNKTIPSPEWPWPPEMAAISNDEEWYEVGSITPSHTIQNLDWP